MYRSQNNLGRKYKIIIIILLYKSIFLYRFPLMRIINFTCFMIYLYKNHLIKTVNNLPTIT